MLTTKEMLADGWKLRVINGRTCLLKPEFGFLALARGDHFYADAMLDVVEVLGRPDKIHSFEGQVQTLEYFNLVEETV